MPKWSLAQKRVLFSLSHIAKANIPRNFSGNLSFHPGCSLLYKNGTLEIKRYFHMQFKEKNRSFEKTVEEIEKIMQESILGIMALYSSLVIFLLLFLIFNRLAKSLA